MILLLLINLKIYDSIENYLIIKEIKLIKEYYKINIILLIEIYYNNMKLKVEL